MPAHDGTEILQMHPVAELVEAVRVGGLLTTGRPAAVARAPGRLDVMGGIADYTGSVVCEMPLAEAAATIAQRRNDDRLFCHSRQLERVVELPLDTVRQNDPAKVAAALTGDDKWARYLVGCLWWLAQHGTEPVGMTVIVDSDVPLGGGVSSSAAIEVATLSAMAAMLDSPMPPLELAVACQQVENRVVGAPCGVMDQVTSAMGREGELLEIFCQPGLDGLPAQVRGSISIPPGFAFVGLFSGVSHEVAGDPYTDCRVAAFIAQKLLEHHGDIDSPYLANVDAEHYQNTLRETLPVKVNGAEFLKVCGDTNDPVTTVDPSKWYLVQAAADHHVLEMSRVTQFIRCLQRGDVPSAGGLMYESHWSYSNHAGLGHPLTDQLVNMAYAAGADAGVHGAKITGGGSGGTVAMLIEDTQPARDAVASLAASYAREHGRETMLFAASGPGAVEVGTWEITI